MTTTTVSIERIGNGYVVRNNRFVVGNAKVALDLATALSYVLEAIAEIPVGEREKIAARFTMTLLDNRVKELP